MEPTFIYPPRPAKDPISRAQWAYPRKYGMVAQYKLGDSRNELSYLPDGSYEMFTRHGTPHKAYKVPAFLDAEIRAARKLLGLSANQWSYLDGGVLHSKHPTIDNTIVIWDILVRDDEYLLGTTYEERHQWLYETAGRLKKGVFAMNGLELGTMVSDHVFVLKNLGQDWDKIWDDITKVNLQNGFDESKARPGCEPSIEGLVFKLPSGKLERAFVEENNNGWCLRTRVKTRRHRT